MLQTSATKNWTKVRGDQQIVSDVNGSQVQLLFNELRRILTSSSNN